MKSNINRRLWLVCKELDIDYDTLHARINTEFGYTSLKQLNDKEGWYLIDVLQGKKVRKPDNKPHWKISDKQIWMIHKLEKELGWDDNPARLAGFIKKYGGCDAIEWLHKRTASAVIEGLKSIQQKGECKDEIR